MNPRRQDLRQALPDLGSGDPSGAAAVVGASGALKPRTGTERCPRTGARGMGLWVGG